MAKHSGLGKGLDSLISKKYSEKSAQTEKKAAESETGKETLVKIELITPNREQPRKTFDAEALAELTESIKQHGVIQPLIVVKKGKGYEIIAGERRYRAAKQAGLKELPVIVREYTEKEKSEIALIENIQREDLDAIEIALAYQRLMDDYNLTQERMSERVGKKRATIANYLRLLKLPAEIQVGIKEKKIEMGHARAILGSPSAERQLALYQRILKEGLSVRKVEELAQEDKKVQSRKAKEKKENPYASLEQELCAASGMNIKIQEGKVVIAFGNEEELAHIADKLR